MKIALAPEGSRGDVFPMLDLGASLVSEGHAVVICAPPGFRSVTEERGLEFRSTGSDVHGFLAAHADALARGGLRLARTANRWLAEILDREFESLPDATHDVDLVLGAGLQLAGPSAAERRGVPYRFVLYCPALLPSGEHAPIPVVTTIRILSGHRLKERLFFFRLFLNGLSFVFGVGAFGNVIVGDGEVGREVSVGQSIQEAIGLHRGQSSVNWLNQLRAFGVDETKLVAGERTAN